MDPSEVLSHAFFLFVVVPVPAAVVAFKGPPAFRQIARIILFCAWLALTAATLACLWYAFGKPSSGIGNQVLLLVAIPVAIFAFIWFGLWRAARRHEYVQSLPPAERRVEERRERRANMLASERNGTNAPSPSPSPRSCLTGRGRRNILRRVSTRENHPPGGSRFALRTSWPL